MIPLPSHYSDFDPNFTCRSNNVGFQTEMTPRRYLDFSILDFDQDSSNRGRVNALSNAKRGLHLQVETLAKMFGFEKVLKQKKGYPNFHKYLEFLEKCGIVTPRILKKLNKVRNSVEHDYYVPSVSETEDFIDVVELFLAATDRSIYQFPIDVEFLPGNVLVDDLPYIRIVETEPFTGEIQLSTFTKDDKHGSITLTPEQDEYFIWLKLMLNGVHINSYGISN